MSPGTIFRKTMIFTWIKLGIALLTLLIAMGIAGIAYLIISKAALGLINSIAVGCGAFLIIIVLYYIIMYRLGYSIRIGQLAIVEMAHSGHDVPGNPVGFSKNIIKERFGSNRKFYVISRDLKLALSEIMRIILRGFTLDKDVPDIHRMRWLLFLFCHPATSCADEFCLTYALRRRDYEVNAACVDALTILVQNWDAFIKRAARLSLIVLLAFLLLFTVFFLPGLGIARALVVSSLPWAVISLCLAFTFKIAFLDSWVLTKVVCECLDLAKNTEIDPKNYAKIDSWSKTYTRIRGAAQKAALKAPAADKDKNKKDESDAGDASDNRENDLNDATESENNASVNDENNADSATEIESNPSKDDEDITDSDKNDDESAQNAEKGDNISDTSESSTEDKTPADTAENSETPDDATDENTKDSDAG